MIGLFATFIVAKIVIAKYLLDREINRGKLKNWQTKIYDK